MFSDLALAKRLERTEASAGAAFVEARGARAAWTEIAGAYAMFDGVDSPLSQTFGLGMFEPATDTALTQIEEFFQARGGAVHHEVCPLAGVALSRSLAERGYVPCEMSNVLYWELPKADTLLIPVGAMTVRVAGPEDLPEYAAAAQAGWSEAGEVAHLIADLTQVMFAATGYVGFMVRQAGKTIATAGLVIHDGVALLAGASTIPEARGQGAQRKVLAARLQYAASAGCDLAMFVAEPGSASQRNAERSGFHIAYTRTKWRRSA
jgi:GNAT superfamily N-acetyltransferase